MSRCAIKVKGKPGMYAVVGLDPPLKEWFAQLWDPSKETEDEEGIVGNFTTRSNGTFLSLIEAWNPDREDSYTDAVLDCIGMDMDPKLVPRPV